FTSLLSVPTEVSDTLTDTWSAGLQASATSKIKSRWDTIASDPGSWANNVATPASARWSPMIDTAFVSRSGRVATEIIGQHFQKLADSHQNAKDAHDAVFADDGAVFKASVEAKKANWQRGVAVTLAMTGDRQGGTRGPASKHTLALAGDPTFLRDVGGGDTLIGTFQPATPFVSPSIRQQFKAAMAGILTQSGVLILKGVMTTTDANARLDALLTGFLDAAYDTPPNSFIHFESVDAGFALHTLIVTP